jgi:uracil-DNA glycosylase family 4
MDPEALVRRYLEQRRELGERELILDTLNAVEALRLVEGRAGRSLAGAAAPAALDWREVLAARPQGAQGVMPSGLVVGSGERELFMGPVGECWTLDELAEMIRRCRRCDLYRTARNAVPGEGNPQAKLMCVGEAPGASEDETGRPFVGQAGQLLTKILAAIKLSRDEVFIANVLKHRPPGNRNPQPEEVEACRPYLVRQVELIRPKVIIAFGTFAAQTLLETKLPIGKLRGAIHRYHGIPVIVTYHPAALLRNPAWKRPTWEDVQLARRLLDSTNP